MYAAPPAAASAAAPPATRAYLPQLDPDLAAMALASFADGSAAFPLPPPAGFLPPQPKKLDADVYALTAAVAVL